MAVGGEVVERGLDVDGLPEDDDVDHEAEGAELVFLAGLVVLAELAPPAVEDVSGQAVAALASAEEPVDGPPVDGVVAVVEDVEGFDQASEFGQCPAQAGRVRSPLE